MPNLYLAWKSLRSFVLQVYKETEDRCSSFAITSQVSHTLNMLWHLKSMMGNHTKAGNGCHMAYGCFLQYHISCKTYFFKLNIRIMSNSKILRGWISFPILACMYQGNGNRNKMNPNNSWSIHSCYSIDAHLQWIRHSHVYSLQMLGNIIPLNGKIVKSDWSKLDSPPLLL